MLGNFIADHIKGRNYCHLPKNIQNGILLHRAIDTFTDQHPIPRISSSRLHGRYSHYSRVIVDIYYDHFLANKWDEYHNKPLEDYASNFYDLLRSNQEILPEPVIYLMPFMFRDNWLVNYANIQGIQKVLKGMSCRAKFKTDMDLAIEELEMYYESFDAEFTAFFEELITFSHEKIQTL